MKKNIFIAILIGLSIACAAFGYRQKLIAEEYRLLAIENELKAKENHVMAEEQRMLAEAHQKEALMQRQVAMEHLQRSNEMVAKLVRQEELANKNAQEVMRMQKISRAEYLRAQELYEEAKKKAKAAGIE